MCVSTDEALGTALHSFNLHNSAMSCIISSIAVLQLRKLKSQGVR